MDFDEFFSFVLAGSGKQQGRNLVILLSYVVKFDKHFNNFRGFGDGRNCNIRFNTEPYTEMN